MALTAAQIVSFVQQIAKCPGYTVQTGLMLNTVLSDLAQKYDFDLLRTTTTLTVTSSSTSTQAYTLPADYLRAREVFYVIGGVVYYLNQIPLSEFDQAFQNVQDYPRSYATDMSQSPPVMYFYPASNLSTGVTVRYQRQPVDITSPESSSTVPWFPNQNYLITRVAAEMMQFTDDTRLAEFAAKAEDTLRLYLEMDDDKEGYAQQVTKDQRVFRPRWSRQSTKQQPF